MSRFWGNGKFPYTNINNLNLDWMIKQVLELKALVESLVIDVGEAYVKPETGIPKSDLSAGVQASLNKADTALQSVPSTYRTAAAQDVIDAAQDAKINPLYIGNTQTGASVSATIAHKSLIDEATLTVLPQQNGTPSIEQRAPIVLYNQITINNTAHTMPSGFYGGVLDYLTGKLKMHARVITLNGSEAWGTSTTAEENRKYFYLQLGDIGAYSTDSDKCFCDAYERVNITSNNTTVGFNILNRSTIGKSMLYMRPANSAPMSSADFKAMLAQYASNGNPIQIVVWSLVDVDDVLTSAMMERVHSGSLQLTADVGSWTLKVADYIGTLSEFVTTRAALALLSANVETGFTASKAYVANDFIVIVDTLLKITAPIQSGGTIQIGVNAVMTTLGAEITALLNS